MVTRVFGPPLMMLRVVPPPDRASAPRDCGINTMIGCTSFCPAPGPANPSTATVCAGGCIHIRSSIRRSRRFGFASIALLEHPCKRTGVQPVATSRLHGVCEPLKRVPSDGSPVPPTAQCSGHAPGGTEDARAQCAHGSFFAPVGGELAHQQGKASSVCLRRSADALCPGLEQPLQFARWLAHREHPLPKQTSECRPRLQRLQEACRSAGRWRFVRLTPACGAQSRPPRFRGSGAQPLCTRNSGLAQHHAPRLVFERDIVHDHAGVIAAGVAAVSHTARRQPFAGPGRARFRSRTSLRHLQEGRVCRRCWCTLRSTLKKRSPVDGRLDRRAPSLELLEHLPAVAHRQ
mmetsp:Transcript_20075/g.76964  ORF Transcript_20075/g.76964 Transcript_20075/m.76964 type:complete len:347 (-) Transcript_20075:2442-3482(-)